MGDGEGGKTLGSLDRNFLAGVLCPGVEMGFFLRVMGFVGVGEGMVSSGNFARFNRRRTSYPEASAPRTPNNPQQEFKSTTLSSNRILKNRIPHQALNGIGWEHRPECSAA